MLDTSEKTAARYVTVRMSRCATRPMAPVRMVSVRMDGQEHSATSRSPQVPDLEYVLGHVLSLVARKMAMKNVNIETKK